MPVSTLSAFIRRLSILAVAAAMAMPLMASATLAQSADTIRVAIPLGFRGLDPHEGVNQRAEVSLQSNIYSSLTRVTPELEVVGDLAESWSNPEPNVWEFKLNPKAKFENGTVLDAPMIVSNFARMFDPALAFTFASDLKPVISNVEAVDATTLRITLGTAYPDFLRRMSYVYFLDTEWAKEHNPKLEANGSGPYRLVRFDPENIAVLEANPDYYGEQPAYPHAEFKVLGTPASRLTALLAGEIDVSTVIRDAGLGIAEAVTLKILELMKNYEYPFPDEAKIRLGISAGIAIYPNHAHTAGDLLRTADTALYQAKKHNRGSFLIASKATGPLHPLTISSE